MNTSFCHSLRSFLLCFSLVASARSATLTVNSGADAGGTCPGADCTLRQAIAAASSDDTIAFALPSDGVVTLTSSELLINKNLTIIGPGGNLLTVQRGTASAVPEFRIFEIAASAKASISGLMITNGNVAGNAAAGGGILNYGTLTITDSAVSGNSGFIGGGIYNSNGILTVTNATISANRTFNTGYFGGGGIFSVGTLTVSSTTISGNTAATEGGGIYVYKSAATITSCTVSGNSAGSYGGGISINGGSASTMNSIIAKNTAPTGGPDVFGDLTSNGYNLLGDNSGATIAPATGDMFGVSQFPIDPMLGPLQDNGGPTKTEALLYGSPAIDQGKYSGSSQDQRGYTRPVDLSTISNAGGGDGNDIGAYEVQANDMPAGCDVANSVVKNNNGGGTDSLRRVIANVCAGATITFAADVRGEINLTGPEIPINKSLTIIGPGANQLTVQRSKAATTNFRIFNLADHLNVVISGLTIANGNVPGGLGGGINNADKLTLANVTISGNSADIGAGIYAGRSLAITNSTISGNTVNGSTAGDGGGGIYNGGMVTLSNTTISGNKAQIAGGGGQGGAIRNSGTVTLTNSTISANLADFGGGIYNSSNGTVNSKNTIIALNISPSGPDVNGTVTSHGFNIIGNSSAPAVITPKQFSDHLPVSAAQLKLDSLRDNGGPTFTHALLAGSIALDRGNSSGIKTDQRGLPRPSDDPSITNASGSDGADIGAVELQVAIAPTPTPTPTPSATPKATPTPTATATPTPASQLENLSTRKQVGSGDNVLIGGFIVVGTENKKVLLRGLGPSLPVAGQLADPVLELHRADTTLLAMDNNWKDKQAAEITATGIPPSKDLESAIVATLAAKPASQGGAGYTGLLAGQGGGTGIGLLEIYDLNIGAKSKLANISTRGFVGTGDDLLIGGFIPGPSGRLPVKVLVRALGPSLTKQGVTGALQDPLLELHNANGTLLTNDNWKEASNASEIQATLPPPDNRESAIITTLAPSNAGYTAVVRGANGTTGVALVEVYALQ